MLTSGRVTYLNVIASATRLQVPETPEEMEGSVRDIIRIFLRVFHPDKNPSGLEGDLKSEKVALYSRVTSILNELYAKFK